MKFKELKNKIKEEQKKLARKIKSLKAKRKVTPYGYVSGLDDERFKYRHKHVAYCQFFNNTPYEKIEPNTHGGLYKNTINKYYRKWNNELEEDVRNCA